MTKQPKNSPRLRIAPVAMSLCAVFAVGASVVSLSQRPTTVSFQRRTDWEYSQVLGASTIAATPAASTSTPACLDSQYFGMNVDMSQIVPDSPAYIRNQAGQDLLDILATQGANMVRVTNAKTAFPNNILYTKTQWNTVLNKIAALHMKAIVLIETPDEYAPILSTSYFKLLNTYINTYGLANHPAVYGIDIKNEPYFTQSNIKQLAKARDVVKAKNRNMLVTIGGWRTQGQKYFWQAPVDLWNRPEDIKLVSSVIDFVSAHLYGFDDYKNQVIDAPDFTTRYFSALRKYTSKPIVISEFGAGNGEAINDQLMLGSKQLQENTYKGVFYATKFACSTNIVGAIGYTLYPRDVNAQGWNIADSNGDQLFPAISAFQLHSSVYDLTKPFVPIANIPKNYLLTEKETGTTLTTSKGDIVAIVVPGTDYAMTVSTQAVAVKQSIVYQELFGKSAAIVTASESGTSVVGVTNTTGNSYSYTIQVK